MFKRALQRLLANPKKQIFVVVGEQWQKFDEPPYSTDPKAYDFDPDGCETKSPDQFPPPPWNLPAGVPPKRGPTIMKAFRVASDAISFAHCCNLDSVMLVTYDRQDGKWMKSTDQSALEIDW